MEVLADELRVFSLDLVGIVCGYALGAAPTPGAKPRLQFSFQPQQLVGACVSLACAPNNDVWCGDFTGVKIFSHGGKFLKHAAEEVIRETAWGIAFAKNEVFISAARPPDCICVCSLDGSFIRSFGAWNSARDIAWPWGVAVDQQGTLYIADSKAKRILIVRADGKREQFDSKEGEFSDAHGIAVNANGDVFVSGSETHTIQVRFSLSSC